MRLFSRDKEAVDAVRADDVPFEALRRSPRGPRKTSGDFDASAPLDPADAARTRARRRLIGAIALGLAAVVFVPMLFDRTPVVPADDIGLQIPDRDAPFEGRRGVPDPAKGPLKPSGDLPQPSSTTPATPAASAPDVVPPAVADAAVVPAVEPPAARPAESARPTVVAVPKTAPVEKAIEKPVDKPKAAAADDPRALAALEGRSESSPAAGDKGYAVQIAAFSAADRARGLRDQLVASGLKSYTESVSTTQGMRTRVRLGPFASREAADRAKQKLKTMKLDGSVVPL